MSEELIAPFTGPMSKETAQFRAQQAVEYYQKHVKQHNISSQNTPSYDSVNGYGRTAKVPNTDGRHSAQAVPHDHGSENRFVRGGQRATVHGIHSGGRQWQQSRNNHSNRPVAPQDKKVVTTKKRHSRGLYRSNSNLEESLEYINVENLADVSMGSKREYGSTSSLDMMNASTSSDSFFAMLQNLKPETIDQRSPAPAKIKEVLRGSKNPNLLRDLEKIANGTVIYNRPISDETDDVTQSPRTKTKFKQKDRKLRSKSITPETGPGVWKRIRGKNDSDLVSKVPESVPDVELKGDDRFRRKAFVHYDSQSIGFDIIDVLKHKPLSSGYSNISTGASAASSASRSSYAGEAEDPDIVANTDDGDGRSNDLVHSCSFFRNEIGGEEERVVGLTKLTTHSTKRSPPTKDSSNTRSAITLKRSPHCCGVTLLDLSPTPVGHILPPHIVHKGHVIEYADTGAYYYRHFFNGQEHQNYFGIDDSLGPVAVSIKREKLEDRDNYLGKSESGLFQFRVILRTRELSTLRGSVLEDAIPASGRLSSSRGLPIKDLLEFVVPDLQSSCLRQATAGQKTCDQLMKLDEQRVFNTYKIGILFCKAGQTTEEDMYNNGKGVPDSKNKSSSPAFDEFLNLIGERVRLKGFENYRAQLDNKTDSTGTHSVYTTFNNCEIMFHVSTMLPFTPKNQQQLLRKRHIGNDIVTIIFQEPGALPFTAKSVRSQFQHVFIIVKAHHPCSDKTSYSIAISRSKDVPPFGPSIPEYARFPKSAEFAQFLLAKVINAENAAHHSEKFYAMASRTRQEYLKDLATNYVTSNSLESASKLSKFALSGKKKEKNKGKLVPDYFALGAIVWSVQVEDVGHSSPLPCYLGIAAETLAIVEESTKTVIFTTHCGAIIGWTSQALSLKLYYNQGECLVLKPLSGDMEELQEILTRLSAVTPGCETSELSLKRNGLGQLGFHIQTEGIVTDVEQYGFAYEAGLRKGSRLVEICKVATVTLTHDQMVDLLRTSATVKVVVIPPLKDGGPRSVVNLHANHHYSSFAALNAVIQAEFLLHQHQSRTSSSSSDLGPTTDSKEQYVCQPRSASASSELPSNVEMRDQPGRLLRMSSNTSDQGQGQDSKDAAHHERDSSSASSLYSPRSTNTLPLQKKVLPHSDHRGEMKSPPARTYYITDKPWQSSSLPRSNPPGIHGYQDSTVSSGRGSLFEGRDTGEHYEEQFGSRRGLDDSTYGTLEERHNRSGSRDSGDTDHYGSGRDWSEKRSQRSQESHWPESRDTASYVASNENLYSSSSSRKQAPASTDYSSIQHGNYAQELLKQSQNTKYLLSHESSRGINSTNSSSANLSDTSFSSGGSVHTANLSQQGSHGEDQSTLANLVNREESGPSSRRRANTTSTPQSSKTRPSALENKNHLNAAISPLSSEDSSPRSSHKNLSGMSSEESLSTRLRPGVTTKMGKSKASTNLQDDLMRLIDPDIAESDLASILATRSSNRRLSGRLVRTVSDESLHSGKAGLLGSDAREALFTERQRPDGYSNKKEMKHLRQARLSPRATGDSASRPSSSGTRVPVPDSAASLDWSSLVDVATKAIEGSDPDPVDRISSPSNAPLASSTLKTRDIKIESLYRSRAQDRPPDPPSGSNPPVWRSVVVNPQQRIQELEEKVRQLEEELAQERQESAALDAEVQRLRNENERLQEESQNAAAQLRRFTEWFFTTIDRQ